MKEQLTEQLAEQLEKRLLSKNPRLKQLKQLANLKQISKRIESLEDQLENSNKRLRKLLS